ncbi:hypothetical protein Ancab_036905 [Ancistrocladus abbreviatus]
MPMEDVITSGGLEAMVDQLDDGLQELPLAVLPSAEVEDGVKIEAQDGDCSQYLGHEAMESTETLPKREITDDAGKENKEIWFVDHLPPESQAGELAETIIKEEVKDNGGKENKDMWPESMVVFAACDNEVGK